MSEWLSWKSLQTTNAGEEVGMEIGAATMENSMDVPQKPKTRATIWSSNSIPGYISEKSKDVSLKWYIHPNVHSNSIYNNQATETT